MLLIKNQLIKTFIRTCRWHRGSRRYCSMSTGRNGEGAFGLFKHCPVQSLDYLPILMLLQFCSNIQEECRKRWLGYVMKSHLSPSNISHLAIHNQPAISFDCIRTISTAVHTMM